MRLIKTVDASGHVLCHDITQIIKDVTKDAQFKRGHVVTPEDIPVLLSLGKEHLYVWENNDSMLHENDAAGILYEICVAGNENGYMKPSEVKEGKIDIAANCDGLFCVDVLRLNLINSLGEMMIATRHGNFPVKKGDKLAGTRVIPLVIEAEKMENAKKVAGREPLLTLHPFRPKKTGLIVTGSEVFSGRIADTFSPVVIQKLAEYDCEVMFHTALGDNHVEITSAINRMIADGADMVICTGGMSVDPDDRTPLAIKNTGAAIVSYGSPVLPGAMFMLAYDKNGVPIMGLPGCVMYAKRTIFDLILPLIVADKRVSAEDLSALGHGGLCLLCDECTFPNCGFGK